MCLFVEKKEKSIVFSLTCKYYETTYTIFSTPSNPTPPSPLLFQTPLLLIIITMSNPSYHLGLESKIYGIKELEGNESNNHLLVDDHYNSKDLY